MQEFITQLHDRAVILASTHKQSEADLIGVLQTFDDHRGYLHFGARSLYDYCERILGLSEGTSYNLITVARRAKEVPALKKAVEAGRISVSKARKIAPVVNCENQATWLALAATKSSREIEREVAKVNPQASQPERFQYTDGETVRAQLDIPDVLMKKLRRIQDLESQRRSKASTFIESLAAAADVYLERNDPVVKAGRALEKRAKKSAGVMMIGPATTTVNESVLSIAEEEETSPVNTDLIKIEPQCDGELVPGRVPSTAVNNCDPIPASSKHVVYSRTGGRCTHIDENGRCSATRWLHIHHIISRENGGSNEPENLTLLCEPHHQMAHLNSSAQRLEYPVSEESPARSRVNSPSFEYRAS